MRFFIGVLLMAYVWGGFVYESEHPVIVLDNHVVEVIKQDDTTIYRELKPARVDDGTCPSCSRCQGSNCSAKK